MFVSCRWFAFGERKDLLDAFITGKCRRGILAEVSVVNPIPRCGEMIASSEARKMNVIRLIVYGWICLFCENFWIKCCSHVMLTQFDAVDSGTDVDAEKYDCQVNGYVVCRDYKL